MWLDGTVWNERTLLPALVAAQPRERAVVAHGYPPVVDGRPHVGEKRSVDPAELRGEADHSEGTLPEDPQNLLP